MATPIGAVNIMFEYIRSGQGSDGKTGTLIEDGGLRRRRQERFWLGSLRGELLAWVAFMLLLSSITIAVLGATHAQGANSQRPARLNISISPSSYDTNSRAWSAYGPLYEAGPGLLAASVPNAHVYGGGAGSIIYHVSIASFSGKTASLSAYLSADEPQYQASKPDKFSDVQVAINETILPVRRVTPDDGRGAEYEWSFPSRMLRLGSNDISFLVKPGTTFSNGLCIYGRSVMSGYPNRSIVLQTK
jgi:hypothetical protein